MSRRIAVLSTGRQDWGILRSTCRLLRDDPAFDLRLIVGGMHCSHRFGETVRFVEEDGFVPSEALPWIDEGPESSALAQAASALALVGGALARQGPEALVLVGDRFETAASALAATLAQVPLVHLHGGEVTEGAMDNTFRDAITKLSHLHLVSHEQHRRRVVAMGEDPATVHSVGAPGLDNLHRDDLADRAELESILGIPLDAPVVLVTLHPATLGGHPMEEAAAVSEAMARVEATYVITLPNTDPGHEAIRAAMVGEGVKRRRAVAEALGERRYWGLMRLADAMLGNSSSALIEAPVLALPAVNVGERQKGRLRGANVVDAAPEASSVAEALRRALAPAFRSSLAGAPSPFGDGRSAERIRDILVAWEPPRPPVKRTRVST